MAIQLDMHKSAGNLKLSLEKKGLHAPPKVELAFDMDISGSYRDEHEDGYTNLLMARLVPWGLVFDPDGQLDVFTFSDGEANAYNVGQVNVNNYQDYVRKNILNNRSIPGLWGATTYAPVLRMNLENFGWISAPASAAQPKRGFFGLGKAAAPAPQPTVVQARKSLVLFNTDGATDRSDQPVTDRLFQEMQDKKYGMYVMFLGVSNQPGTFSFIERMADKYDNVGLTVIKDVRKWVEQDDAAINDKLITDELIQWLKN